MRPGLLLIGITLIVLCFSCRKSSEELGPAFLINCWIHSLEEQNNVQGPPDIFRPCDYKDFGPARYRHKINLKADNQAEYLVLSPIDAHYTEEGTWEFDDVNSILRILDASGEIFYEYEVLEIQEDKLILNW